jgi:predicted HTH domain antitoxin
MATITINVPDEMLESFDSLEQVRETMYEDFIIEQRQRGNISLGRAAELLGISYTEFFDLLGKKGLSFINATPEELNESYQNFEKLMEQKYQ